MSARAPLAGLPTTRAALDAWKLDRLQAVLRDVLPRNPFYAAKLARVDPAGLESLAMLANWPFTFKE